MAPQRYLTPREAAAMLVHALLEVGVVHVEEQVDVVIRTLRLQFVRETRKDDLLVLEALRVMGLSESRIWALFGEWAREFNRDVNVIFEHCWAPDLGGVEEGGPSG